MSKTVGIILTVAAVAFAIAVPVFGPAALGLSQAAAAAIAAGLSAAIMVNNLLMPRPNGPSRQAAATTLQLGEAARSVIFGECAIAGSLVDAFNYGGDYGTDWEVVIYALADHECASLTSFYVNDKIVNYTADGVVTGYNSQLEVYFRSGTLGQTLPSVVTTYGPGWTNAAAGAGLCYVVVAYKADQPDADDPVWPAGRPRFLWLLKGKKCYDPRKDSTVTGGSGAHRWTVPSTWEWTDNPIICRYNWVRGIYFGDAVTAPEKLLIGRGLSETEAPPENTFAPANLCDEVVSSQKRFRIDGPIYSTQKFLDVEEEIAAACAGVIIQVEGSVEIEPAQARTPSFAFSDGDLISGSSVSWNRGMLSDASDDWVNTVVARYVEPNQKWGTHAAPVRRFTADVIADGGSREQSITLDLVKRIDQAGVVAELARRMGRLWGRAEVTLGPRFADVEEGDWGTWQSDRRFGGATKTFRVESFGLDQKFQNKLGLREIASSVYAAVPSIADGATTFTPSTVPTLPAPPSGDWALAPAMDYSGNPYLSVTGHASPIGVETIIFQYRLYVVGQAVDVGWSAGDYLAATTTEWRSVNIFPSTQFEASVRYRVAGGALTARRILGPVTTGASASITTLIAQSTTQNLTFSVSATGVFTISNHNRIYADKSVAVTGNASFATGAAVGDLVLIYYDDAGRSGGAVTYQKLILPGGVGDVSSAFPSDAHPYRHFVCRAVVPATGSTGGGSSAGSGGGTGGGGTGGGGNIN